MTSILIDTDPGIDDVLALLYALSCDTIHIQGITTVAGNVSVEIGTRNALKILEVMGEHQLPIAKGAARPLRYELTTAISSHGKNGLGDIPMEKPKLLPRKYSAIELLKETIDESKEPITIVALGPLTNLALLYCLSPDTYAKIQRIVFMGGAAFCPGNVTEKAEFNIFVDPDAAKLVFHGGVPLVMIGLDVTKKIRVTKEHLTQIESRKSWAANLGKKLMEECMVRDMALHDPLTIGYIHSQDLLSTQKCFLDVKTDGIHRGETVVDSKKEPNAEIGVHVKEFEFMEIFLDRINEISRRMDPS